MPHLKPVLKNSSVLMIVDRNTQSSLLHDYLVGFGLRVLVAESAEQGLTLAQNHQPDIILLDVILKEIDGFETCRRLKKHEATSRIPIIFIAAQDSTIDKVRGFTLGAVDYITKPIQSEEVLARLKTHLMIQRLHNELEKGNERLRQEIVEREELISELDAFAHTVAHDLKNPVGVTMTHAQFLTSYLDKLTQEDIQKYTDTILKNGQKITSIIDELLLLASVRTEKVAPKPLDMGIIVEEAQARLTHLIEEYQAEVIIPETWPVAWGYGPWVEEIWTNYCSNALKYGGRPPRVELGATIRETADEVKFWVKDDGPGLSLEAQQKIFVPFTRLSQAKIEGHGLGLSIVQRIVDKLGGRVEVESKGVAGKGCTFSFYLPLYEASPI